MVDRKESLSQQPSTTTMDGSELVPFVQGGLTKKGRADLVQPLVSVKWFGAVGDGVEDDTSAFQSAAASGRPVFVPAGSYKLTASPPGGAFFTDGALQFTGAGFVLARNIAGQYDRAVSGIESPQRWQEGSGGSIGTGRNVNETFSLKIEAEAPFDGVAIAVMSYEGVAGTAFKAVVAATETFSTATQDSRYRPVVGSTVFNALRGSGAYGWDAVTWAGAANVTVPAGSTAAPGLAVSDFMPINSVPRADGGTRPLLLMRVHHDGATTGTHTFNQRTFTSFLTPSTDNRGRLFDVGSFAGDAVGSLGSSLVTSINTFLMFPIFRYHASTVTVACVGDSISAGTGSAAGINNWCKRACADVSTTARPVVPMNMGLPSQTTATFLAHAKVVLAAAKPNIAFYSPYSPNDSITTSRGVQDAMARLADFSAFCKRNGIALVVSTPVPNGNLSAANDAFRVAIRDNVRAMGASGQFIVADFTSVTSAGGSPETWVSGLNFDNLHPNDAGYEAMATVAKAAIIKAMSGA